MRSNRWTFGRVVLAAAALVGAPFTAQHAIAADAGTDGRAAAAGRSAGASGPTGQRGEGRGRGQGRGGGMPRGAAPLNFEDRAGFDQIFDGVSMKNWDGDPTFWKAENGSLVGTSTAENTVKENTFVIWRGGEPADFELKLEYRMSSTNSGIQFRSTHLPPGRPGTRRRRRQVGAEGLPGGHRLRQPVHRHDLRREAAAAS